jgi:hypothetical protein
MTFLRTFLLALSAAITVVTVLFAPTYVLLMIAGLGLAAVGGIALALGDTPAVRQWLDWLKGAEPAKDAE